MRALFDFGSHGRLRSHDRKALRIIRSTETYDIPWAERVTLRQQLSKSIKSEADRRGLTRKQIQADISNDTAPEITSKVILDAIQNMAIQSTLERELAESKKKIVELERKLVETEIAARGKQAPHK
jgi:hypothetical protein